MTEDEVLIEQEEKKDSKEEGTSVWWGCSHGPHRHKKSQPWDGRSLLSPAPWDPQSLPPWSALFSLFLSQLHPQQISATLAAVATLQSSCSCGVMLPVCLGYVSASQLHSVRKGAPVWQKQPLHYLAWF